MFYPLKYFNSVSVDIGRQQGRCFTLLVIDVFLLKPSLLKCDSLFLGM